MNPDIEILVYDYEGIANVLADVLNSIEIKTLTAKDKVKFQRNRPRVECALSPGGSLGNLQPVAGVDNTPGALRELTFDADLTASVITHPEYELHSAYRAKVRSTIAVLKDTVNGSVLKYHKINSIRTNGSPFYIAPERGLFRTDLHYKMQFSIQYDAFGAFAAPVVNNGQVDSVVQPNGFVYCGAYSDPNIVGFKPNNINAAAIYYQELDSGEDEVWWRWSRSLKVWIQFAR